MSKEIKDNDQHQSNNGDNIAATTANSNNQNPNNQKNTLAVEIPSIELPRGGGAIKGIDEKFLVNAVNGTASLNIPIPVPVARGFTPGITLTYNSGSGNGIFGMGWSLSNSSITRKTEKELPQYEDKEDSDTYIISGAEDLVPAFQNDGLGNWFKDADGNFVKDEIESSDKRYLIRFYRPRIEEAFSRIERWTEKSSGIIFWKAISRENITVVFGSSVKSRIANPDDPKRIFEWLADFSFDDKGNCCLYEYSPEDFVDMPKALHNANRENGIAPYTNTYVKRILTGNISPYKKFGDAIPTPDQFVFETVFDYYQYDTTAPPFTAVIGNWKFRKDAFSSYRSGFEIRTCRICSRILVYHRFKELPGASALVKSLDFEYGNNGSDGFTFLLSATLNGYTKQDDGSYTSKAFPPFSFRYQPLGWNKEISEISAENLEGSPSGIDENAYQFVDLYSEGLSGILSEQSTGLYYKSNLGNGIFSPEQLILTKPNFSGLGKNLQLVDLDSNGLKQFVGLHDQLPGYFELDDNNIWQPHRPFEQMPTVNRSDPNTRQLDLTGDGKPDLLTTEDDRFGWYPSLGKLGYKSKRHVQRTYDEEVGPAISFSDPEQKIFLADMTGDGLTDMIRVRNGEIAYWPSRGFGLFGAKITMDNAPVFDAQDQYNPSLIRFADIDGSGTNDIIYMGRNQVKIWLNRQGNSFSPDPVVIDRFPEINLNTKISVADLLGNGLSCLVWSNDLPGKENAPLRYVDLMKSQKPHILVSYSNNLGRDVFLTYTPSTQFYLNDKLAGRPWATKLHFPVFCVSKTTSYDRIRKTRFASEYTYHHGYYDHAEKEFRGFGRVDQVDSETIDHFILVSGSAANNIKESDLMQTPVLTKTWYHTGAMLNEDRIWTQFTQEYFQNASVPEKKFGKPTIEGTVSAVELREAMRACKGVMLRREIYELDKNLNPGKPYLTDEHSCLIRILQPLGKNKYAVFFSHENESITYNYDLKTDDPRVLHNFVTEIDDFGNIKGSITVSYPRFKRPVAPDDIPDDAWNEQNEYRIIAGQHEFSNSIIPKIATDLLFNNYRTPLHVWSKSYELTGIKPKLAPYFTIDEIRGDFNTAAFINFEVGANGTPQKRIFSYERQQYKDDDGTTVHLFGTIGSKGLLHESFKAAFNDSYLNNIYGAKSTVANLATMLVGPAAGGYVQADGYYWAVSGTRDYDAAHFFLSTTFTDPFGNKTFIAYDNNYRLFVESATDPFGNSTLVKGYNYRTLSPYLIQDKNQNLSGVRFDEIGMPVRTIIIGKSGANEGDVMDMSKVEPLLSIDQPTSELFYDIKSWSSQASGILLADLDKFNYKPQPNYCKTTAYEVHFSIDPSQRSKTQISYTYADGTGSAILKKIQAEPDLTISPNLRWIGNGRLILNNKGNPVKQYENYFSDAFTFDDESEIVQQGVTPVLHYDAIGRTIQVDLPNGTFRKVIYEGWRQISFDENDTVTDSDWYKERTGTGLLATNITEHEAAIKASTHYDTPTTQILDPLGRSIILIQDNKIAKYYTFFKLDISANNLLIKDPRKNPVMQMDYNMLNQLSRQNSMDSGVRWAINNATGKSLMNWDERNFEFSFSYDKLRRLKISHIKGGENSPFLDNDYDIIIYGEELVPATAIQENLLGKPAFHYDTAGKLEFTSYDFKGALTQQVRHFCLDYKSVPQWKVVNRDSQLDLTESFTEKISYDAMGRITNKVCADSSNIVYGFNRTALLQTVDVIQNGNKSPVIKNITYDAKGQRMRISYGNNTFTNYQYDSKTFRLVRLTTSILSGDDVQDWVYTYDPVGNMSGARDEIQPITFYKNQKIELKCDYAYDPLYRITSATGREQDKAVNFTTQENWNDSIFLNAVNPGAQMKLKMFTQEYGYDEAGNLTSIQHDKGQPTGWLRQMPVQNTNNRLVKSAVNGIDYPYTYHATHGFIISMPHLQTINWNFLDQLQSSAQQVVKRGTPETTFYVYDFSGTRVRKITENASSSGNTTIQRQRYYISETEVYREYNATVKILERKVLNINDDRHRVLVIETLTFGNDNTDPLLFRYQVGNNLGSVSLELTGDANNPQVISYEEYHPFGTTAYQANNLAAKASPKRYRFTGLERDEENGFSYHGARYYIPWLGRWPTADPLGIADGTNVYSYAGNNPIKYHDKLGTKKKDGQEDEKRQLRRDYFKGIREARRRFFNPKVPFANPYKINPATGKPVGGYDKEFFQYQVIARLDSEGNALPDPKTGKPQILDFVLQLKPGKSFSAAIQAIYDHPENWTFDCATFVQVVELYGKLKALGPQAFDAFIEADKSKTIGLILLRQQYSTGLQPSETYAHEQRDEKTPAEKGDPFYHFKDGTKTLETRKPSEVVKHIPRGSLVTFLSLYLDHTDRDHPYLFENTIFRDRDVYAAFPVSQRISARTLISRLEQFSSPGSIYANASRIDQIQIFNFPTQQELKFYEQYHR